MANGLMKIVGCSSCPYLTVLNDGIGALTKGECGHPIHNKQLGWPIIPLDVLQKPYKHGIKVVNPQGRPEWCPLV